VATASQLPVRSCIVLLFVAAAIGPSTIRSERDATPPPGVTVPEPSECRVEPRPDGYYANLYGAEPFPTQDPGRAMPPDALPQGSRAGAATVAEVEALVYQLVACDNANDIPRTLALVTDAWVLANAGDDPSRDLSATPVPAVSPERVGIVAIKEIRNLGDGRVSAVVTTAGGHDEDLLVTGTTSLFIFARVEGRLLLDENTDHLMTRDQGRITIADAVSTPLPANMSGVVPAPPPGVTIPDPAECRVEPRTTEDYQRLLGTAPAATPDAPSSPLPGSLPTGDAADATTVAEIEATVREVTACANGGDLGRTLALLTDRYLRSSGLLDPASVNEIVGSTPEPVPAVQRTWVVSVTGVRVLPDGRVSAIVTRAGGVEDAHPTLGVTELVTFARVDGRFLIDESTGLIALPDEGVVYVADAVATAGAAGTPAP